MEKMCPWQICRECGARGHGRRECPFEGRLDSYRIERNMIEVEKDFITVKESIKTLGVFADQFGEDTDTAILNLKSKVNKLISPLMGEVYGAVSGELERRRPHSGLGEGHTRGVPLERMKRVSEPVLTEVTQAAFGGGKQLKENLSWVADPRTHGGQPTISKAKPRTGTKRTNGEATTTGRCVDSMLNSAVKPYIMEDATRNKIVQDTVTDMDKGVSVLNEVTPKVDGDGRLPGKTTINETDQVVFNKNEWLEAYIERTGHHATAVKPHIMEEATRYKIAQDKAMEDDKKRAIKAVRDHTEMVVTKVDKNTHARGLPRTYEKKQQGATGAVSLRQVNAAKMLSKKDVTPKVDGDGRLTGKTTTSETDQVVFDRDEWLEMVDFLVYWDELPVGNKEDLEKEVRVLHDKYPIGQELSVDTEERDKKFLELEKTKMAQPYKDGFVSGTTVGPDIKKGFSDDIDKTVEKFYNDMKRNGAPEQQTIAIVKSVKDFLDEAVKPYVVGAATEKTSQNTVEAVGKKVDMMTEARERRHLERNDVHGFREERKTHRARHSGAPEYNRVVKKERTRVQSTTREEPGVKSTKERSRLNETDALYMKDSYESYER